MAKKKTPLKLLEIVEPFLKKHADFLNGSALNEGYYVIRDKDQRSDFYLKIYAEPPKGTTITSSDLYIEKAPGSVVYPGTQFIGSTYNNLGGILDHWAGIIIKYNSIDSVLDDPILKAYQQEFYAEFEIIEEGAETSPLKTNQILLLDRYLEDVKNRLTGLTSEQNTTEINEIQEDIDLLRKSLTTKSKKWVVSKLTNIWAKIAKQGIVFIKEFLSESKKEAIKQGIKGLLEIIKENGHDFLNS